MLYTYFFLTILWDSYCYYPFYRWENKAQKSEATCPRCHRWQVVEPGLYPGHLVTESGLHNHIDNTEESSNMEKQKGYWQTIYISLHTHTNNSSGGIHNFKNANTVCLWRKRKAKKEDFLLNIYGGFWTTGRWPMKACFKNEEIKLKLKNRGAGKEKPLSIYVFQAFTECESTDSCSQVPDMWVE